ncbi:MAG: hypothetical protein BHW12_07260 [Coprobacillus sp. 28_7]|nr:MAG: hypothetical protein BHW12_07260 [Coprobacillus sp. 28_7]
MAQSSWHEQRTPIKSQYSFSIILSTAASFSLSSSDISCDSDLIPKSFFPLSVSFLSLFIVY